MITYKASGIVLGNYWDGGSGGYTAKTLMANTLPDLKQQILAGIADGSLDSGMGYESLIGAAMNIKMIDKREIDGKIFTAIESNIEFFGDLSAEQEDFLIEATMYI